MSILIKNGILLTMNDENRIIKDGAIFINQNRIDAIGKTKEITREYTGETVLDATGRFVLPGFINAHCHTLNDLLRGLGTDMTVVQRLGTIICKMNEVVTKKDVHTAALLGCIGNIRMGCTQFIDSYMLTRAHTESSSDHVATAITETGLRAGLWQGVTERSGEKNAIMESYRAVKKWHQKANGRITVLLGPVETRACAPEVWFKINCLAEKYGLKIQTHLAEEYSRVRSFFETYEKSEIEWIYKQGLLGPNFIAIHAVWLTEKDLDLLVRTDTRVVHCPTANMFNSDGVAPVPAMLKRGISVALGTDIYQDMFSTIRCATYMHKVHNLDPFAMTANCALRMATIDGAKAIGQEKEIGSLEVGKKADIITINYKNPHLIPMHNPIPSIVYCANGNNVDNVIVDGRAIMRNSVITSISEHEVLQKAQEVGEKIVDKAALNVRPFWGEENIVEECDS